MRHFPVAHGLHFTRHSGIYHFKFSFYKHKYVAFLNALTYKHIVAGLHLIYKETIPYNTENGSESQGQPSIMDPGVVRARILHLQVWPVYRGSGWTSTSCGWAEWANGAPQRTVPCTLVQEEPGGQQPCVCLLPLTAANQSRQWLESDRPPPLPVQAP